MKYGNEGDTTPSWAEWGGGVEGPFSASSLILVTARYSDDYN